MSAKQKCSRGNGSNRNEGRERPRRLNYTAEFTAILKDIFRGALPLRELPRFLVWISGGEKWTN